MHDIGPALNDADFTSLLNKNDPRFDPFRQTHDCMLQIILIAIILALLRFSYLFFKQVSAVWKHIEDDAINDCTALHRQYT